jgi:hypothetical protein
MKLLLSTAIVLGGLLLTKISYAQLASGSNVTVAPRAFSETTMTVLPCGKIVSKGLKDGTCKKDALAAQSNPTSGKSGR